jgi:hypothetical protein
LSNALAIASVTAVLKDLLDNALIDHSVSATVGGPVNVTTLPPDRIKLGDEEKPQLNLYLYQVAHNSGWSNVDLPSRNGRGDRVANPPLSLDLYYLLSAYGEEDFQAEILLGYAMQMFHETPILTREAIRKTLGPTPPVTGGILPPSLTALVASELADQVEMIKITPQPLSLEEIAKLWAAFQSHFRMSAIYRISVVLIESKRPTRSALPVREPKLHVVPFALPVIETVSPQAVPSGAQIILKGVNLKGEVTRLEFGTGPVVPDQIAARQINATLPAGLPAGVRTVMVTQQFDFGTSIEPHRGFESNVAAFILTPQITTPAPINVARGATLTLDISPPVGRRQRVALLAGDQVITIPSRLPTDPPESSSLSFPIPADFPTGSFLLRVRVDGAESPLLLDSNGQYDQPRLTIT